MSLYQPGGRGVKESVFISAWRQKRVSLYQPGGRGVKESVFISAWRPRGKRERLYISLEAEG